ncbi:MAG: hypothetical protein CME65_01325 [Halobacteriovoraceae bacterium]|nr:hypothetical protein [Halobacteriovoraceae bacterium]|tara:strand:+ start:12321 stop:12785 length:465 start_codon:yes stop_codon:yes gene_type:complete
MKTIILIGLILTSQAFATSPYEVIAKLNKSVAEDNRTVFNSLFHPVEARNIQHYWDYFKESQSNGESFVLATQRSLRFTNSYFDGYEDIPVHKVSFSYINGVEESTRRSNSRDISFACDPIELDGEDKVYTEYLERYSVVMLPKYENCLISDID